MRTRVVLLSLAICALTVAVSSPASGRSAPKNACPPGSTNTDYCQVAPGQYCKGLSKKKIPGQKKSPFAQCTSAMAKLSKNPGLAPSKACNALKKTKKAKARPAAKKAYRACVKAGKRLEQDLANSGG
jgi:hypothetical protein